MYNLILLQNAHGSPSSDKCILLFVCLYFHENHTKSHSKHIKINARRSNYSIKKKAYPKTYQGCNQSHNSLVYTEKKKLDNLKCIIQAELSNPKHLKLMRFYQNTVISTQ